MDPPLSPIDEEESAIPICRLCNEQLKDPRNLSCSHTFCRPCLENAYKPTKNSQQYVCTICGTKVSIPTAGISALPSPISKTTPPVFNLDRLGGGVCKMCLSRKPASEYCVECALPLCNDCLRQHAQTEGTSKHTIISVKKVNRFSFDTDALDAKLNNPSTKLDDKDQVKSFSVSELRSSLQQYQISIQAVSKDASTYLSTLKEVSSKAETVVCDQVEKLHNNIEEQKKELMQKIQSNRKSSENSIQEQLSDLKKTGEQMAKVTDFLETISKDAVLNLMVFTKTDRPNTKINKLTPLTLSSTSDKSSTQGPKTGDEKSIPTNSNQVTDKTTPTSSVRPGHHEPNADLKPRRSILRSNSRYFLTKFRIDESLTALTSTVDGTLAVTTYSSQKCSVYSEDGLLLTEINKGLVRPISVLSLESGKLLVADLGDDTRKMGYKMYYTDGELFPTHLTISEAAWGMAETAAGDLVVCHPEPCKVCIYDRKGRTKLSIKTVNGQNLFSNPRCVCVGPNGDIIVSDFEQHRVMFFDAEGNYKCSFGSQGQGTRHLHHPCGVCADSGGNVVIADSENHRISLVSSEGKFIKFLLTEKDGLKDPVAVCITREDKLLIGEWSGRILVIKYDLLLTL